MANKSTNLIGLAIGMFVFLAIFIPLISQKTEVETDFNKSEESNKETFGTADKNATPAEIAVCIVYDTSGSMNGKVFGKDNVLEPKYVIASRALRKVIDSLQKFSDGGSSGLSNIVFAGLLSFKGMQCPIVKFDKNSLNNWLTNFNKPEGGTPLGIAIEKAWRELIKIKAFHKHILVLTDGGNTDGEDPSLVIPRLNKISSKNGKSIQVHVIGFDVKDKVFLPLRALGVNVFSANDEKELMVQLDLLLKEKFLLEAEDPPANKTTLK